MPQPVFLNDLELGAMWISQPVLVSQEEIIAFARQFDPQPYHVDPEAAASGPFGGLIASGWHLAALTMRQICEAEPFGSSPILGLGVDELRWLRPVRPGDVLRMSGEIVELRPSKSKPDRGTVRSRIKITNQAGEVVMSYLTSTQLPVRGEGGAV